MEIKSLDKTDFETIFKAFSQAFADYEIQINGAELRAMLKRRGFNPNLSFAAFEDNEIVSFTFNGIGAFNGIPTAYDTGTGTLQEYRGKGLATEIFEYSIQFLKKANIKQYLLEVLQHNEKAVSVYRKIGFSTTRELNYFKQKNEEIRPQIKTADVPYSVKRINVEHINSHSTFWNFQSDFWDFRPSWQNSFEAIQRASDDFICLGAFEERKLVGYCVFEPASGDLAQIAVDKEYRIRGIATFLLREIIKMNRHESIKVINTDILQNSITKFLTASNIPFLGKQFEMIKQI
jgi:ribosomal protein S18 acetylase RimI-like enzyme